jgi:hypothetical protein
MENIETSITSKPYKDFALCRGVRISPDVQIKSRERTIFNTN